MNTLKSNQKSSTVIRDPLSPPRPVAVLLALLGLGVVSPSPAGAQPIEWNRRLVTGTSATLGHAMVYDSTRGVTVLFGGRSGIDLSSARSNDTWEWNGSTWTQRVVSGPSGREYHAMVYDASRRVTVLFGGTNGQSYLGDTWEWNGTAWSQRTANGPSARYWHSMAYDSARGVTVLFGGIAAGGPVSNETWEWNGTVWTQMFVTGPSRRTGAAMTYDESRGVTVLFGGNENFSVINSETWEWNGAAWSQRFVAGPSRRSSAAMVYDSARNVAVLFGGHTDNSSSETWEWDGTTWTQRFVSGPSHRSSHAMAYDAAREAIVLYAGYTGSPNDETWEMSATCAPPSITTQPVDQAVGVDAPVTFFVEATSTHGCTAPEPLTFQWQRRNPAVTDPNGANAWIDLSEGGGFINTRTAALLISRPTPGLATGYRCHIGGGCVCRSGPMLFTNTDTVNFSVACPADFNADGGVDFQDVEAFFIRWENGC